MRARLAAPRDTRPDAVAFCALAAAVASVGLMPWLLWADEAVYRWLQFHRTCATAAQADALQLLVTGTLAAVVAVAVLSRGRRHPREVAAAVLVVASGAAVGELLKTAIERLRPRSLPIGTAANSFPSGHVMNTALIATVACLLVRRSTLPAWARRLTCVAAIASVAAQAGARVLRGSHWISDMPGSVLVAIAWALGASAIVSLPPRRRLAAFAAALGLFAVSYSVPAVRLVLPSALDDPLLRQDGMEAERPGGYAQVGGGADGPERRLTVIAEPGATVLKVALQASCAERPRECCASVSARVNEWDAPPLTITSSWHEFHLAPPDGVLRAGPNTVVLKVGKVPCGGAHECARIGVALARVAGA